MKDESSPSVAVVAGMMAAGGLIAVMAVNHSFAASQMLDPVMVGREAAIMRFVLRGAIKNAALCGCLLLALGQCWCGQGKWWLNWRPMALPLEVGLAAFAACSLCGCLARLWLWFAPSLILPLAALGGWRGLQLVDLAMQCGFTLLLYALANWIQRKIESARSATSRVAFVALAVCLFVGIASPAPHWIVGKLMSGRHAESFDAEEEEKTSPKDDFRLDVDEPWKMISYFRPSFDDRCEKEGKMKNVERAEMAERGTDAAAMTGAADVGTTAAVTTACVSAACGQSLVCGGAASAGQSVFEEWNHEIVA